MDLTVHLFAGLLGKAKVELVSYHRSNTVSGHEWNALNISSALQSLQELKQHVTEAVQAVF